MEATFGPAGTGRIRFCVTTRRCNRARRDGAATAALNSPSTLKGQRARDGAGLKGPLRRLNHFVNPGSHGRTRIPSGLLRSDQTVFKKI